MRKIFALIILLVAGTFTMDVSGEHMKKERKAGAEQKIRSVILPAEWKMFRSDLFTAQDAATARFEDDFLIPFQGKDKIKPVILKPARILDLALGKNMPEKTVRSFPG